MELHISFKNKAILSGPEAKAVPIAVIMPKSYCVPRAARVFPLKTTRSTIPVGEWLSLVEHLVRDQGVGGSNPLSPTNLSQVSTNIVITNLEASSSMEICARRPTLLPILNSTNIFHLSAE